MAEINYITPLGHQRLLDEKDFLQKKERPRVVEIVSWAASLGDRSENADYQYGKKRLREIDRRLRFLNSRLNIIQVIDPALQNGNNIKFGATVLLENEDGSEQTFSIVGVDEINTDRGLVSWKSPIGKNLIGKEVGDNVRIVTPSGRKEYSLLSVEYMSIAIDPFIPPEASEVVKK